VSWLGSQRIGERTRRPLALMTVSILPDAGQLNAIMRNIATHLDAHVKTVTVSNLSAVHKNTGDSFFFFGDCAYCH